MQTTVRFIAALFSPAAALTTAVLVFSHDGATGPIETGLAWLGALGFAATGTVWMFRWPTRYASQLFVTIVVISIASVSLSIGSPLAALIGCVTFIGINIYIASVHRLQLLIGAMAVSVSVVAVEGVRLWTAGHYVVAIVASSLVASINVVPSILVSFLVGPVGFDMLRADRDPLTALLNRRGFWTQTRNLMALCPAHHSHLIVSIVDLDRFKVINDSQGHVAGDRALVAVAESLRIHAAEAVVARIGGEEFAFAFTATSGDQGALARCICQAIADLPERVTASLGTAGASLIGVEEAEYTAVIEDLVVKADSAMYRAKRRGGNQSHCHVEGDPRTGVEDHPRGLPPPGVMA